jgi:hypothetical protein
MNGFKIKLNEKFANVEKWICCADKVPYFVEKNFINNEVTIKKAYLFDRL